MYYMLASPVTLIDPMAVQARQKQFRVGPAKIGSSTDGASRVGEYWGMVPQEILKFSFSKTHIWRILCEH